MSHGAMTSDEDDWETADLSSIKAPKVQDRAGQLRPSAPLFQPRAPSASQAAKAAPTSATLSNPNEGNSHGSAVAPSVKLLSRAGPQTSAAGGSGSGTKGASTTRVLSREATESDGDDWFGQRGKVTNRQLWETANASTAAPPTILAPSAQPMPQPTIQILRRDQAAPGKQPKPSAPAQSKTMEEREEQYRIARERIFGPNAGSGGGSGTEASASDANAGPSSQQQADSVPSSRTSSGKGRKRRPKKDGAAPQMYLVPSNDGSGYDRSASPSRTMLGPGPTPHQVRVAAPAPVGAGSLRSGPTQGIVRQPRGAEAGIGFGAGRHPGGDMPYGSASPAPTSAGAPDSTQVYDPSSLDDQMAHWMSQASFGSTPRGHTPQPY